MYIHSPGLRPNGVSGSFLDDLMVKGPFFELFQGTPPAQKLHAIEYSKSLLRPFGAPRLDLLDLLPFRGPILDTCSCHSVSFSASVSLLWSRPDFQTTEADSPVS